MIIIVEKKTTTLQKIPTQKFHSQKPKTINFDGQLIGNSGNSFAGQCVSFFVLQNLFHTSFAFLSDLCRNCLRRIARHDDQEFSNQSIINVMEKFVKTVNAMDETILVPSRLMDRQVSVLIYVLFFPFSPP